MAPTEAEDAEDAEGGEAAPRGLGWAVPALGLGPVSEVGSDGLESVLVGSAGAEEVTTSPVTGSALSTFTGASRESEQKPKYTPEARSEWPATLRPEMGMLAVGMPSWEGRGTLVELPIESLNESLETCCWLKMKAL